MMSYGNYAPFYRGGYFNPMQVPTMPNMAENQNQFVQPYQMPVQQPQIQNNLASNDMLWVLNENEATSYPVAPNNTVTLWDKNEDTIYIKSVNAQGVPSMRILDFSERTQNAQKTHEKHTCQCGDKFVTKEQFNELSAKYDEVIAIVEELKAKPTKKTTKETAE